MDLLYSRYASPMELVNTYINQGRFGEFVTNILEMDSKRKREQEEKENEEKLWSMYIHSMVEDMSFNEWKAKVVNSNHSVKETSKDEGMTNEEIEGIINKLFPGHGK